jgi:hypothetical protein
MDMPFHAGMRARQDSSTDPGAWFINANRVSLASLVRKRSRARRSDEPAGSDRVVIVSSLFLVLFATALLIGGRAEIAPLLQSAAEAREANSAGEVIYTMPDGIFCRHMSFDNVTALETEGPIERCRSDIAGDRGRASPGFSWRTN